MSLSRVTGQHCHVSLGDRGAQGTALRDIEALACDIISPLTYVEVISGAMVELLFLRVSGSQVELSCSVTSVNIATGSAQTRLRLTDTSDQ